MNLLEKVREALFGGRPKVLVGGMYKNKVSSLDTTFLSAHVVSCKNNRVQYIAYYGSERVYLHTSVMQVNDFLKYYELTQTLTKD